MQRSVFGLFTALLGVLCVLSAIPAFRKKRYGLAVFLFLNAFTNLVNTIHAFYVAVEILRMVLRFGCMRRMVPLRSCSLFRQATSA